jgi:hypothetical protein
MGKKIKLKKGKLIKKWGYYSLYTLSNSWRWIADVPDYTFARKVLALAKRV